ncbi:hypothetical protein FQN53_009748 [Emmonsiellopsis sp. PD_33]|nr:hypothetical protein FQN53_009748 [Emmonsiellopsis sp. PD_33]
MLASPPKRRRSNSSSAIPVSASNTTQSQPQPPLSPDKPSHRASFRSPTRSSLARSHPDVLRNVLGRSPAKVAQPRPVSRGRESSGISGIRSSIPLRPSLAARETGETGSLVGGSRRGSSVPDFVAPPRRTSERGRASFSPGLAPEGRAGAIMADARDDGILRLRFGAGRAVGGPDDNAHDARSSSSSSSEQENGEPELPPTPTELGRERARNRQKGLLSSSPSWRQEKKRKRRLRDGLKPSPLKPKEGEDAGDEQNNVFEPTRDSRLDEGIPREIQEKQKLRDALAAQLALLKEDITQLEDAAQQYERPDEYPEPNEEAINNLIELLTTSNPSCAPPPPPPPAPPTISSLLSFLLPFSSDRFIPQIDTAPPPSPPPENPFALEQPADLTPYLTVFAALSLTAHTSTSSSLTQTHTLRFTPPPPFPSHLFQIPISFQTDPEKQAVLSISIPPQTPFKPATDKEQTHNVPPPLHTWLANRLSNPLLNRDISSLCWGISRYWEADIARAKLWVRLEELRLRITSQHQQPQKTDQSKDGKYTPRTLLPHLGRTSLLFSISTNTNTNPNPATSESVELLITCPLVLDLWTSEPHFAPDVSVHVSDGVRGPAKKVEREAKRVFGGFLIGGFGKGGGNGDGNGDVPIDADPEVLVRAVEGVVGVVFGEG